VADYDLVRDILDEQLVDEDGQPIGKADGILMELPPDGPPRLLAIEVGLPVLGYRLLPAFGRALERLNRWMGFPRDGCARLPLAGIEVRATEIRVPVEAAATGALSWERWIRRHVIDRLPGGRGPAKPLDARHAAARRGAGRTPSQEDLHILERDPDGKVEREVHLDRLVGRKVIAPDGRSVGRVQEIRVEWQGDVLVVTEYLIGTRALIERLSAGALIAHDSDIGSGYCAWWHELDLRDPTHPRLTCPVEQLRTA
jgi:hypothetical protein